MKGSSSSTIPIILLTAGVLKRLLVVERNLERRKAISTGRFTTTFSLNLKGFTNDYLI